MYSSHKYYSSYLLIALARGPTFRTLSCARYVPKAAPCCRFASTPCLRSDLPNLNEHQNTTPRASRRHPYADDHIHLKPTQQDWLFSSGAKVNEFRNIYSSVTGASAAHPRRLGIYAFVRHPSAQTVSADHCACACDEARSPSPARRFASL